MKHLVGHTQNDIGVYVDLVTSKAAKHIARQPHLLTLAAEALRSVTLDEAAVDLEHDMGRIIGYDCVVKVTSADTIFYAQPIQDSTYTKFTKNGKPLATCYVSMILERSQKGAAYAMHDIWIGRLNPPRPGSAEETAESKAYWEVHALVFEDQPIQLRTLTKTCPY